MTIIEKKSELDEYLRPMQQGEEISAEHRAWMDEQIRQTLAKKKTGKMAYTPLGDIRRKYGF